MAARSGRRAAAVPAPIEADLDDDRVEIDDDDNGDGEDDLDLAMEQLTGEAEYVVLWRTDGTTGKQEHVDKVPLSRFTAEYVRDRHGGGDYMLRAYGPKLKGGRRGVKKYKEFSIDKSLAPKSGSAVELWKSRAPLSAAVGPVETRREMPEWVRDMLAATIPALVGAVVANLTREKTADPLLVELIRSNGAGKGTDPIELQKLLADERARAIQLGREMNGGKRRGADDSDDDRDPLLSVVGQGIETLSEFAAGYRQNAENEKERIEKEKASGDTARLTAGERTVSVAHGGDVASLPADASGAAPAGTDRTVTQRAWVVAAAPYMGMLVVAKKMQPGTAALLISDNLDDEPFADLMADIEDETGGGILARLATYFPSLANVNIDWFRAVLDEIVAMADPQDEPAAPATPENGTATDAGTV